MSDSPSVSVIIPNRDRLIEIGRALKALRYQTHRNFEVIVVSNQVETLRQTYPEMEKTIPVHFDEQNISSARNAGIAHASGQFVAFLDDDAVPEPTWLANLIVPFEDPQVAATGGLVRGRNGVSYQWGPQEVDCFGNDWPLPLGTKCISQTTRPNRVLKTVGTNCAFRASVFEKTAFDPAYRYYLDETDINWRLSGQGFKSVIVPDAEVHHGYAKSIYRDSERVPKSLTEIGASKAYFCKRFGDPAMVPDELDGFRKSQRARLIRLMELGFLDPGRIHDLQDSLEEGFVSGAQRITDIKVPNKVARAFLPYVPKAAPSEPLLLTTRIWNRKKTHRLARAKAEQNQQVTVFDFSYTALMLTVRFTDEGYWLHRGGIFGRTKRSDRLINLTNFRSRAEQELIRIAPQRKLAVTTLRGHA